MYYHTTFMETLFQPENMHNISHPLTLSSDILLLMFHAYKQWVTHIVARLLKPDLCGV